MVYVGGRILRLHSFLELFEENTLTKICDDGGILIESCIGDVPQRISNYRYVKNCEIIDGVLVIFTEVKSQEEMDLIDEE